MELNEERNIVLKAFYYDLDKGHRIKVDRIEKHLKTNTAIDHNRIHLVLQDLEKEGYIELIPMFNEYKITHKGEKIVEDGGFGNWKKEPSIVNNISSGGGDIIGNTVGNQSFGDFLFEDKKIINNIQNNDGINNSQKSAPKTIVSKIWWWIDAHKVRAAIVGGLILFILTYFIKNSLDKKYNPPQTQSAPKQELKNTPKK